MPALADLIARGRRVEAHRPCPRVVVDDDLWRELAAELAEGARPCSALWGDVGAVHMAPSSRGGKNDLRRHARMSGGPLSVHRAHSSRRRSGWSGRSAIFTASSRWGCRSAPLARPWALGRAPSPGGGARARRRPSALIRFLRREGESLHQIPVGPVHAGIIEPGHFRFTANGEAIVRLEERLGYTHKGVEGLMTGAPIERAARLAGRMSGDSTVAYAFAFARAVEAALDVDVPPRAIWLRALMAELERLANHFGDIGAICNDVAFALMHAHCGVLRERVLRAAAACFGHRLMMDCIVPGGVGVDLSTSGAARIRELLDDARRSFPAAG